MAMSQQWPLASPCDSFTAHQGVTRFTDMTP